MLNPIEEAQHAELKKMCRELKVPAPPEIMIGLRVHDRNGDLIFDDIQRGHSWTRNYWNLLFALAASALGDASGLFQAGKMSDKNPAGTVRSTDYGPSPAEMSQDYGFNFRTASAGAGIWVGTGDTAFSVENVAMAALVAHGNSASQLYYAAMTVPVLTYAGAGKTWTNSLARIFNNNSGGSITIKETGLGWRGYGFSNFNEAILVERSVLSPAVAVPNGAQLTVTYEISMDFSAID